MTTGATFVDFTEKRLIGNADLDDRFLAYTQELIRESFEKSFRTGGVFDVALDLAADGNDKIQITGTSDAVDGLGHLLDIVGSGYDSLIQFQNTLGGTYDVALHYCEVPDGVQVNPRTGIPEYIGAQEFVGEVAEPDTVIDNGNGTITFQVDSVTEAAVSNAGRKVRVWRKVLGKNATTPAIAIEELTVVWTGQNRITTAGELGQEAVSTTAADYLVALLGPTVKRNTSLVGVDGYAFLGEVIGVGAGSPPTVFDTTNQDVITASLSDLQDITSRNATTDRLKVDVKSYTGDINDPQIAVRDPGGSVVYSVDGNGNVVIEGTTTQQNFVQVNASETITDNLTAGDAAIDSHLITGTWTHQPAGGGTSYFEIDGATGRIGIGQAPLASGVMGITGDTTLAGDFLPAANNTHNIGSPSLTWANFYVNNLVAGHILPLADNTYDIGSGALRWQDGHFYMGRFNHAVVANNPLASLPSSVENFWVKGEHAIFPNSTIASAAVTALMTSPGTTNNSYAQALDVYGSLGSPGMGTGAASRFDSIQSTAKVGGTSYIVSAYSAKTDTWSSPSITHLAGFHVQSTTLAYAGVTNRYGLWVQNVYGGTNNYAIKTEGVSALISFDGPTIPGADNSSTLGRSTDRWGEAHIATWLTAGDARVADSTGLLYVGKTWPGASASNVTNDAVFRSGWNKGTGTSDHVMLTVNPALLAAASAHQSVTGVLSKIDSILNSANVACYMYDSQFEGVSSIPVIHYHVTDATSTGTLTDQRGLHIDSLTAGSSTNYAIYVAGANDSLFGGGALRPITDGTGEIGTSSYRWDYLHSKHLRVGYGGPTTDEYLVTVRNPVDNTDLISATSTGIMMSPEWDNASSTGTRNGVTVGAIVEDHSSGYGFIAASVYGWSNGAATTWTNHQIGLSCGFSNSSTSSSCPTGTILSIGVPSATNQPWINLRGIYIDNLSNKGATTNYALHIANQTSGYAIYGGSGLYLFGGNVTTNGTMSISGFTSITNSLQSYTAYPQSDNSYDLGTTTYKWRTVFAHAVQCDNFANTLENIFYRTTTNGYSAFFRTDGNSPNSDGIRVWAGEDTPGATITEYLYAYDGNGSTVGRIMNSSGVFQLQDLSDPRAKTRADGTPADKVALEDTKLSGLDIVKAIRLVEFKFRARKGRGKIAVDDPSPFYDRPDFDAPLHPIGFDARNCAEVFPPMASKTFARQTVKGEKFGEELWATSKAELIPVLTKAIQEQQAQIESLKKRLDKLAA